MLLCDAERNDESSRGVCCIAQIDCVVRVSKVCVTFVLADKMIVVFMKMMVGPPS
jgi:hypothetical protein